jgi:hypothetical protein
MATYLGGKAEISVNGITIPAHLLSEVNVELTEGLRETETLGGTFRQPTGVFETAEASFTMYLPSMDYLKNIFPDVHNDGTGTQTSGNLIFGSDSCSARTGGPVVIHFTCDDTDDNDVTLFNGIARMNFNPSYTTDDNLSVEVTLLANPDEDGNVARLGTGDLTQPSIYDATSQATVPVTS